MPRRNPWASGEDSGPPPPGTHINPFSVQAPGLYVHFPLWDGMGPALPYTYKDISSNELGHTQCGSSKNIAHSFDPLTGYWLPNFPGTGQGNAANYIGICHPGRVAGDFAFGTQTSVIPNPATMSVSIWFKPTTLANTLAHLVGQVTNGQDVDPYYNYGLQSFADGSVRWLMSTSGGAGTFVGPQSSTGLVTANGQWWHLLGTYDGKTAKLYLNGKMVASSAAATPAPMGNSSCTWTIGGNAQQATQSQTFNGLIMDFRTYNYCVGDALALQLYEDRWGLWTGFKAAARPLGRTISTTDSDTVTFTDLNVPHRVYNNLDSDTVTFTGAAVGTKTVHMVDDGNVVFSDNAHTDKIPVSSTGTIIFSDLATVLRNYQNVDSDGVTFSDTATFRNNFLRLTDSTNLIMGPVDSSVFEHGVISSGGLIVSDNAAFHNDHINTSDSVQAVFSDVATGGRYFPTSSGDTVSFSDAAQGGRTFNVSASDTLNLSGVGLVPLRSGDTLTFSDHANTLLQNPHAASRLVLSDVATAKVVLNATTPGLRTVLYGRVSGVYPNTYTQTPDGKLLIANGIDPVIKWDGHAPAATTAGVKPPTTAATLVGTPVNAGGYAAYVRFLDGDGNPSNLSPLSNQVQAGLYGSISAVTIVGGLPKVTSTAHGLTTGATVTIANVLGATYLNGFFQVTVVDSNNFTVAPVPDRNGNTTALPTLSGPSNYQSGGTWTTDVAVSYTGVPTPVEPKVVRRQVLRNTTQQSNVYYVDVDTTDLVSTTFTSTKNDNDLIASVPVPLFDSDGNDLANVYLIPPNWKSCIISHLGRVFLAVDVTYDDGSVQVTRGSTTVTGIGTAWIDTMVGRFLSIVGSTKPYEIASVDPDAQTLELIEPYGGTNGDQGDKFAVYAIRPALAESRLVYFSGPGTPEGWNPFDAFAIQDDGDNLTGLALQSSFLYVLEERHIYKFSYQNSPSRDGFVFLAAARGCINQRCCVYVEGSHYMLDTIGVHKFNGDQSVEPISDVIQTFFQQGVEDLQINWDVKRHQWHAAHDPLRQTIRWFISMTDTIIPRHALCYNYRQERWWIEEYQVPMGASCVADLGARRSLVGTYARKVIILSQGHLDGVGRTASDLRADVATASMTKVTATAGTTLIGEDVSGVPLVIVGGRGQGQVRRVDSVSGRTIEVDRPWSVLPDDTSTFQLGGIPWVWRGGWYHFVDSDGPSDRTIEAVYEPTLLPGTFNIKQYFDHAKDPRAWSRDITQDGIAITAGLPNIVVNLNRDVGHIIASSEGHREVKSTGDRFVSVSLDGVSNNEAVRVYHVRMNGLDE